MFQQYLITSIYPTFVLLTTPGVPEIMECPAAFEYYTSTRTAWYGKDVLKDLCPRGEERKEVWKKMRKEFDLLDSWMSREEGAGVFIMGETPSYADFILGGMFMMTRAVPSGAERDGEEFDTIWDVMKEWHGGRWSRLMDGLTPYMEQK